MKVSKWEWLTLAGGIVIVILLIIINGGVSLQNGAAAQKMNPYGLNISKDPNIEMYDVQVGTGKVAENGSSVLVNYVGTFTNGQKFDSSYDRNQPLPFTIGKGDVIKGWDIGIAGMKVGGKRHLVISYPYAYGENGYGPIPPKATLIFDVELVDAK